MHIALYRKYRPRTFSQVIGQKYVVNALKNQIANGKAGHAFLFTGVRGTGKTSCAKIFAKAINCLNPVNGEPCLECDVCKGIENESVYDVVEMDAASNNSVDDIRDVLSEVNYLPVMAKYRVYIIDEVHMLSMRAFNALLKTLEEPPAHVIFILCTTEIHKVPATILSRCQRYDFTKLTVEDIRDSLLNIAKEEKIILTPGAAKMIASLSDGAMRDANSILDTCISVDENVNEDVVSKITGTSKDEDILAFSDSLINGNTDEAMLMLRQMSLKSIDMKRLCEELITHFSNLILCGMKGATAELLGISQDKFNLLKQQASECPKDFSSHALRCFTDALDNISKGQNSRIALDMAIFNSVNTESTNTVVKKTPVKPNIQPQQTVKAEKPVAEKPEETVKAPDTKEEQPVTEKPHSLSKEELLRVMNRKPVQKTDPGMPADFPQWNSVIELMKNQDEAFYHLIKDSTAYLFNDIVYIKGSEMMNQYIRSNREINAVIKQDIFEVCGRRYNIGGYRNIAHLFEEKQRSSIDDVLSLRELGVTVNIKD